MLDIRYIENYDQLLIFYNCNYGSYYGCPSEDGHYIIYRDITNNRIVGIEIFNFEKIIESNDKITDIVIEYDEHIDTLAISKSYISGICSHNRLNDSQEWYNASVIWRDRNNEIIGVDIHKFKEKIRRF